eukprot:357516-Chlamydomonas_euryale.AAC.7
MALMVTDAGVRDAADWDWSTSGYGQTVFELVQVWASCRYGQAAFELVQVWEHPGNLLRSSAQRNTSPSATCTSAGALHASDWLLANAGALHVTLGGGTFGKLMRKAAQAGAPDAELRRLYDRERELMGANTHAGVARVTEGGVRACVRLCVGWFRSVSELIRGRGLIHGALCNDCDLSAEDVEVIESGTASVKGDE